jgi:hypothetical protein
MNNLTQPAYPVVPLQDNFKRLIVPIPGISKLEHFALEIYKTEMSINQDDSPHELMNYSINQAITFLEKLEETQKNILNEKESKPTLIQS